MCKKAIKKQKNQPNKIFMVDIRFNLEYLARKYESEGRKK